MLDVGFWFLVLGVWFLVLGIWNLVLGACYFLPVTWNLDPGS